MIADRRHFITVRLFYIMMPHQNLSYRHDIPTMSRLEHSPGIACLLISHLPIKAERRRYPQLRRRPLVIVEAGSGGDIVLDSSAEAKGVVPEMTLQEALEMCGSATVMQADHKLYCDVDAQIVRALERRFGHVERDGPGRVYVPLDQAAAPYGEAHLVSTLFNAAPTGFNPSAGFGPGRFIAYALASVAPDGGTLRAPIDPLAFLRNCTVALLPLASEKIVMLREAGLKTLGSLADSPYADLQALLGAEARQARSLALGIDPVPSSDALRAAA